MLREWQAKKDGTVNVSEKQFYKFHVLNELLLSALCRRPSRESKDSLESAGERERGKSAIHPNNV